MSAKAQANSALPFRLDKQSKAKLFNLYKSYVKGELPNRSDFESYYSAVDDPYGSSGTGGSSADSRPSLQELTYLSQYRIGPAHKITRMVAEDTVRNKFEFTDLEDRIVKRPDIFKWMKESDFFNQLGAGLLYERQFGIGFITKHWATGEDMSQPPPNTPPRLFLALSPVYFSPLNTYKSRHLDYDPEVWSFMGGVVRPRKVHPDRVEVLMTRPIPGSWRGLSALEPIYLSLMAYYNTIVYSVRGIAKWGHMVPVLTMGDSESNQSAFNKWLDLMIEFQMNNFFLIGRNDKLDFPTTSIGQGLTEIMEFLKEDISSGSEIPLNYLFGRAHSGGIGDGGALTSERYYMNKIGNIQQSITDDVENIIRKAGFDISENLISWNLAIQKTREQRLSERAMELQIELMEEQLKTAKLQTSALKIEVEQFKKNPQPQIQEVTNQQPKQQNIKADFQEALDRNYKNLMQNAKYFKNHPRNRW